MFIFAEYKDGALEVAASTQRVVHSCRRICRQCPLVLYQYVSAYRQLMTSKPDKKKYRHVREGEGHVFSFHEDDQVHEDSSSPETIRKVGTYGCLTCVGVYFAIDNQHCFIAHINPIVRINDDTGLVTKHDNTRFVTDEEGKQLRDSVAAKLRLTLSEHCDPDDQETQSTMVNSIVLACPNFDETMLVSKQETRYQAARYVVEGIKDVLKVASPFVHKHQGFVVKHPKDEQPEFFVFEESVGVNVLPPELPQYEQLNVTDAYEWPRPWQFDVYRKSETTSAW